MYVQRVRLLLKIWISNLLLQSPRPSPPPKKEKEKVHLLNEDSLGAGAGRALG